MKSVLISIQPKWCELIASGKKTVEVRKTKPKIETPFKVYIYETKAPRLKYVFTKKDYEGYPWFDDMDENEKSFVKFPQGRGKVIGEFVCNGFDVFHPTGIGVRFMRLNALHESCLSVKGINDYLKSKKGYGWRISDLVIYDKPKELSEFVVEGDCACEYCNKCKWFERGNGYNVENDCLLPYTNSFRKAIKPLFRPPQSWCYVEGVEEK